MARVKPLYRKIIRNDTLAYNPFLRKIDFIENGIQVYNQLYYGRNKNYQCWTMFPVKWQFPVKWPALHKPYKVKSKCNNNNMVITLCSLYTHTFTPHSLGVHNSKSLEIA